MLHDNDAAAMGHLDELIARLRDADVEIVQDLPDTCVPIERGVVRGELDALMAAPTRRSTMTQAVISGVAHTHLGELPDMTDIGINIAAATAAVADAGLTMQDIDGLLVQPPFWASPRYHMLIGESLGIYVKTLTDATSMGGASYGAMLQFAKWAIEDGLATNVLVVAGEKLRTGHASGSAMMASVGAHNLDWEYPFCATIPAYYALLAQRYLHEYGLGDDAIAPGGGDDAQARDAQPGGDDAHAAHAAGRARLADDLDAAAPAGVLARLRRRRGLGHLAQGHERRPVARGAAARPRLGASRTTTWAISPAGTARATTSCTPSSTSPASAPSSRPA